MREQTDGSFGNGMAFKTRLRLNRLKPVESSPTRPEIFISDSISEAPVRRTWIDGLKRNGNLA